MPPMKMNKTDPALTRDGYTPAPGSTRRAEAYPANAERKDDGSKQRPKRPRRRSY